MSSLYLREYRREQRRLYYERIKRSEMEAGLESNDGINDIVDEENHTKSKRNQEPVCNDELDTVENPTNEEIKEFHEAPKCLEEKKIL